MSSKVKSILLPRVEVVLHGHGSADTLAGADGPVLLEGASAIDGGLVGAGGDVDVVGAPVGGEAAFELGALAGVVGSVGFDHVVFDLFGELV